MSYSTNAIINQQIELCREVLDQKSSEYVGDSDNITHNFELAAVLQGIYSVQALGGMMVKHTVSIYDMIREYDPFKIDMEAWTEKITDHINYLILLKILVTLDDDVHGTS